MQKNSRSNPLRFASSFVTWVYLLPYVLACSPPSFKSQSSSSASALNYPLYTDSDMGGSPIVATDADASGHAVGGIPGSFAAAPDGSATAKIPLWVSPGRAGMQPDLSLNYSSNGGNGVVGVGWNLSGDSSITRCNKTYAMDAETSPVDFSSNSDLSTNDAFCLDGNRLIPVTGTQSGLQQLNTRPNGLDGTEYRTALDIHAKIISHGSSSVGPTTFEVHTKDGRTYIYGASDNDGLKGLRTVRTPSGDTQQFVRLTWALSEVKDVSGNYMTYSYRLLSTTSPLPGFELLLDKITYGGSHFNSPPIDKSVEFIYGARDAADVNFSFVSGFQIRSTQRLIAILVKGPGLASTTIGTTPSVLRQYFLSYQNNSITHRTLLSQVSSCDATGVCLEPTTINWELGCQQSAAIACVGGPNGGDYDDVPWNSSEIISIPPQQIPSIAHPLLTTPALDFFAIQLFDVNGDGKDDLLWRSLDQLQPDANGKYSAHWKYALSNGNTFGPAQLLGSPGLELKIWEGSPLEDLLPIDVNGDGVPEILKFNNTDTQTTPQFQAGWELYMADPSHSGKYVNTPGYTDTPELSPTWQTVLAAGGYKPGLYPQIQVADIDGDGLPDILRSKKNSNQTATAWFMRQNNYPFGSVYQGGNEQSASFTNDIPLPVIPPAVGLQNDRDHTAAYAVDIDGDGRSELLVRVPDSSTADLFSDTFRAVNLALGGGSVTAALPISSVAGQSSRISNTFLNATSRDLAANPSPTQFTYRRHLFMDLNGDGLPESVAFRLEQIDPVSTGPVREAGDVRIAQNIGGQFGNEVFQALNSHALISPSLLQNGNGYDDVGVRVIDYNGDGKSDLLVMDDGLRNVDATHTSANVQRTSVQLLQANGLSFNAPVSLNVPIGDNSGSQGTIATNNHGYGQRLSQVADVNGDGLPDIVQMENGTLHVHHRLGKMPDRITGISGATNHPAVSNVTFSTTGQISVQGAFGSTAMPWYGAFPDSYLHRNSSVIVGYDIQSPATLPGQIHYALSYLTPRQNNQDRGFLGFAEIVTDDTTRFIRSRVHYAQADRGLIALQGINLPNGSGLPTNEDTLYSGSLADMQNNIGLFRSVRTSTYHAVYNSTDSRIRFYVPDSVDELLYTGTHKDTHQLRSVTVDNYGNITKRVDTKDDPQGGGTPYTATETLTYAPSNEALWLVGQLQSDHIDAVNANGQVARQTNYTYDTLGRLQTVTTEPSGAAGEYLLTTYTRDAYGNIDTITTSDGTSQRSTGMVYDPLDHTFPSLVADGLHPSYLLYHSGFGVISGGIDPTGGLIRHRYDGFGRLKGMDDLPKARRVRTSGQYRHPIFVSTRRQWPSNRLGNTTRPAQPDHPLLSIRSMGAASGGGLWWASNRLGSQLRFLWKPYPIASPRLLNE